MTTESLWVFAALIAFWLQVFICHCVYLHGHAKGKALRITVRGNMKPRRFDLEELE